MYSYKRVVFSASQKMFPWQSLSVPEAVGAGEPVPFRKPMCIGSDRAALLLPAEEPLILILRRHTHDCKITLFSWFSFADVVCIVKFYFPAKVARVFMAQSLCGRLLAIRGVAGEGGGG